MFNSLKKYQATAPWVLFAFYVLCFLVYPNSPFAHFFAQGGDDYTRLVRVRDLLNGAGWHDDLIANLGPLGSEVFWSRLVDLPLYVAAKVFSLKFSLSRSLELAALWIPLLYTALLIPLGSAMARPFVPKRKAWIGALALLSFVTPFLFQFRPGRIDHHALFLLFAGGAFAALVRFLVLPRHLMPIVLLSVFCALGMAIGGAFIPMVLLITAILALCAAWKAGVHEQRAGLFGMGLGVSCLLLLAATRPSEMWFSHALLWFSGAHVLLALLIGGLFIFFERFTKKIRVRELRLVLMALLAGLMALLFFALVPEAWQNPLGDFDASSAQVVMGNVSESRPLSYSLSRYARTPLALLYYLLTLLPVFAGLCVFGFKGKSKRTRLFYLTLFFWGSYLGMALFFQARFLPYVQLFSVPFLSFVLWKWGQKFSEHRVAAVEKTTLLLIVLFGFSVLLPWAVRPSQEAKDLALFYASSKKPKCDIRGAAASLAQMPGSVTFANMMNDGPPLLYYTKHRVLAAPYNVSSNKAMLEFFSDRKGDKAKAIAEKFSIDYVITCKDVPRHYLGLESGSARKPVLVKGRRGQYHIQSDPDHPTLLEKLIFNEPPSWLRPDEAFYDEDYLLYKVKL